MNRRSFLAGSMTGLIAGWTTAAQPELRRLTARVAVDRPRGLVESDAIGLSFESSLLARSDVFDARNDSLVALIRALAPAGVIRIGANDSEFCRWTRDPAARIAPPFRWLIRPGAIDRLAGFLDACGWRLIYGVNLGHGEPARAADEAAYVTRRLGERLMALQVGNEPDLYAHNGLRADGYSVSQCLDEWRRYVAAIRRRVPDAPIAGPDVAYGADWVDAFARRAAHELRFASCHHYATGPAEDPRVDIASMLAPLPQWLDRVAAIAADAGLRWRITEGNSCYNHGKRGVSDTLASALWAIDTLFEIARRDCLGFCFHCGPGRPYTVVDLDPASGRWQPRPIYYGLQLAAQALGAQLVQVEGGDDGLRLHAGVAASGAVSVIAVNVDPLVARDITIGCDRPLRAGRMLSLHGPALAARHGLTLGGVPVEEGASAPIRWSPLASTADGPVLSVPPATALLARFEP